MKIFLFLLTENLDEYEYTNSVTMMNLPGASSPQLSIVDFNVDGVTSRATILHFGVNDVIHNYSYGSL